MRRPPGHRPWRSPEYQNNHCQPMRGVLDERALAVTSMTISVGIPVPITQALTARSRSPGPGLCRRVFGEQPGGRRPQRNSAHPIGQRGCHDGSEQNRHSQGCRQPGCIEICEHEDDGGRRPYGPMNHGHPRRDGQDDAARGGIACLRGQAQQDVPTDPGQRQGDAGIANSCNDIDHHYMVFAERRTGRQSPGGQCCDQG